MVRKKGHVVPPMGRAAIHEQASRIRSALVRLTGGGEYVHLDRVYEILPSVMDGFRLEVCDEAELGPDHGQTFPDELLIKLRRDVYDGMCRGQGRDRFTGAHELGHLFLHQGATKFARLRTDDIPVYRDSEWQADEFSSGFLIPPDALRSCSSVSEVMRRFGVSEPAAELRFRRR